MDIGILKDTLPKDADGQAELGITASQLKDSLKGGIVFLSNSKLAFGIDLKKLFSQLPNSASLAQLPFKATGDFNEEFLKEFFKPYIVIRP